jgi:hypothetical protein
MSRFRQIPTVILLCGLAAIGLAWAQPKGMRMVEKLGKEEHVYAIPNPEHLKVFSLGYRAALADLLFGLTLVDAGTHFVERRVFWHLDAYLEAVVALEPRFRDVYYYADTMLNLSTVEMPRENLRKARDLQERGLKLFPDDPQLWMSVGMFVAYVAPQRLPASEEVSEWKAAGVEMIQHACDVWPKAEVTPRVCVSSFGLLEKTGKTEAAIASLERLLAMTDDPTMRAGVLDYLTRLTGERAALRRDKAAQRLEERQMADLPGLDRTTYQLLVPATDVRACVGLTIPWNKGDCASSFAGRSEDAP